MGKTVQTRYPDGEVRLALTVRWQPLTRNKKSRPVGGFFVHRQDQSLLKILR